MALVDRNLDRRSSKMREPTRAAAEAFVQYLYTPEAQAVFAESGFRFWPQTSSLSSAYLMWQKTFKVPVSTHAPVHTCVVCMRAYLCLPSDRGMHCMQMLAL